MTDLFRIYTVDGVEATKIASMPDVPHCHDYEELLIGVDGYLEHFIDFRSEKVFAPYVTYVARGKVHRVVPGTVEGKCLIWVLRFKANWFLKPSFSGMLISIIRQTLS